MFFNETAIIPTHRYLLHEFSRTEVAAYSVILFTFTSRLQRVQDLIVGHGSFDVVETIGLLSVGGLDHFASKMCGMITSFKRHKALKIFKCETYYSLVNICHMMRL